MCHLPGHVRCNVLQEAVLAAELVLATLLETARVGDAGPATVARNAAGRLDTPGAGHVPGDTPWPRREPGTCLDLGLWVRLDTPGAGHVPGDTPWPRRETGALDLNCLTEALMCLSDLRRAPSRCCVCFIFLL